MGREDLHHNMEDTFDDTEIIKTGDWVAYDCAYYIGRARAYPLFFFLDRLCTTPLLLGREKTHFLLRLAKDTDERR